MAQSLQGHVDFLDDLAQKAHNELDRPRGPAASFALLSLSLNLRKIHHLHAAVAEIAFADGLAVGIRRDVPFLEAALTLNDLTVLYAWAAFECGARQAWEEARRHHPDAFPSMVKVNLGSFNNAKLISKVYLDTFGRDPLARGQQFEERLTKLHANRNVVVHNAGKIDRMFVKRMGGHERDVGHAVGTYSGDVQEAVATAHGGAMAIVEVVHAWEASVDPGSVKAHTPYSTD